MPLVETTPQTFSEAQRLYLGRLIAVLAVLSYVALTGVYIQRVIWGFSVIRAIALAIIVAELVANGLVLVWVWRGRLNQAGWGFLVVNLAGMAGFVLNSSINSAPIGVVLTLALGVYASAVLPRHQVARGILFSFAGGALVAALGYLLPGRASHLAPSDTTLYLLLGLIVVFGLLFAGLFVGFTLQAKLLLASSGTTWLTAISLFVVVYGLTHFLPGISPAAAEILESALAITGAAGVIVSSLVAQAAARAALRPLHFVVAAAERVAAGDLDALGEAAAPGLTYAQQLVNLELHSQDEVGDLLHAFNGMTARLRQTLANWEQKVRELTQTESQLRESQRRLQAFISAMPQPAFLLDREGNFLAFNAGLEKDLARGGRHLPGQNAFSFLPPPLATARKIYFDYVLQTGEPVHFEDRSDHGDYLNYMYPVCDEAGQVRQVAVLALDITERRQAEQLIQAQYQQLTAQHEELQAQTEELQTQDRALARAEAELRQLNAELEKRVAARTVELAEANRQLAALNQELESFSHSVSHDLRAPLRTLTNYARWLTEDYTAQLDSAAQHALERIQAGAAHMSTLIEELLQLSRLTRADLRRVPLDLSALAQAIVHDLRAIEPARQVDFVCAPGLTVRADPALMRAVLQNLLGNAWKFTTRHPTARVELGQQPADGETVYFVRDDGAGFEMAYADRLFGAFQRLHTAEEFEGTGIGLATVQRILHRHGGRIWAEGAPEQGATFYFTLPDEPGPPR